MKWSTYASTTLVNFLLLSFEPVWAIEHEQQPSPVVQQSTALPRCQSSEHREHLWIAMTIAYPVHWKSPETVGHPDIRVRIVAAAPGDDPIKVFEGIDSAWREQGTTGYESEKTRHDRYTGSDGNEFYIKQTGHSWIAYRRFREYAVSYQYSNACSASVEIDEQVLQFLVRSLRRNQYPPRFFIQSLVTQPLKHQHCHTYK